MSKIRQFYLYAVSIISLVIMIISTIGLLHLVIREYVLDVKSWEELDLMADPKFSYGECSDDVLFYTYGPTGQRIKKEPKLSEDQMEIKRNECQESARKRGEERQKNDVKRELSIWISMLIVSLPVYLLHWKMVRKERS